GRRPARARRGTGGAVPSTTRRASRRGRGRRPGPWAASVLHDRDGLGRAAVDRELDLVGRVTVGVDDDRDADVVEVEHTRGPEPAVARAHAFLAVDLD